MSRSLSRPSTGSSRTPGCFMILRVLVMSRSDISTRTIALIYRLDISTRYTRFGKRGFGGVPAAEMAINHHLPGFSFHFGAPRPELAPPLIELLEPCCGSTKRGLPSRDAVLWKVVRPYPAAADALRAGGRLQPGAPVPAGVPAARNAQHDRRVRRPPGTHARRQKHRGRGRRSVPGLLARGHPLGALRLRRRAQTQQRQGRVSDGVAPRAGRRARTLHLPRRRSLRRLRLGPPRPGVFDGSPVQRRQPSEAASAAVETAERYRRPATEAVPAASKCLWRIKMMLSDQPRLRA